MADRIVFVFEVADLLRDDFVEYVKRKIFQDLSCWISKELLPNDDDTNALINGDGSKPQPLGIIKAGRDKRIKRTKPNK
jgi:hypothetical protein